MKKKILTLPIIQVNHLSKFDTIRTSDNFNPDGTQEVPDGEDFGAPTRQITDFFGHPVVGYTDDTDWED